jgi:hypothetical protein
VRKTAPPRGASLRTLSDPKEVIPISKDPAPRERWKILKDIEGINDQIERLKKVRGGYRCKEGVFHPDPTPTPEAQRKIDKLKTRRQALESELDAGIDTEDEL